MISLNKNQKLIILIAGFIIVLVISYYILQKVQDTQSSMIDLNEIIEPQIEEVNPIESAEDIIVHIAGSVKNTGIIKTKDGARISDIIELAGGLTEEANISKVNLAYRIEDGQKIYIPSISDGIEEEHYITNENGEEIIERGNIEKSIIVNINSASQTELELLPGIGPSTAASIIKHREENGKFTTIEDIKNVPGIGDSKFESIKEFIKVK